MPCPLASPPKPWSRLLTVIVLPAIAGLAGSPRMSGQAISKCIRTDRNSAAIDVWVSRPAPFRIPRTVYGTFLEDIGHSVFGGVSAQLLDNPSLESYDASLRTLRERFSLPAFDASTAMGLPLPWLPLHAADGWRYEPRWGHAANSERYLYVMGLGGGEVGIRQSLYVPIERERAYRGVLFAAADGPGLRLRVSFRQHDRPERVLASTEVNVPPAGSDPSRWHKLGFELHLPEGAVAPLTPVDFAVSLTGPDRVSLDEIRLYPADAIDGLDPEVIRLAKALRSPLLRYGGNFTSGYHWWDGVGPLDRRPTRLNQSWGYPVFNDFGTDELMDFCRLIGARPQICLNLGSGSPEEARAWVAYCQAGAKTPEGRERAANGHFEPYRVAAWELGNELWGHFQIGWQTPQGYAQRYEQFYRAIRDLVPRDTLIFANGADVDASRDWNGALIDRDGADLRYLTSHFVVDTSELADPRASRDAAWAADLAIPVGVARALEPVEAQIEANPVTRGRVKIAYTEWLFVAPDHSPFPRWDNLGGALIASGWLNMILSHAGEVPVSDMTGLLEFAGIHKSRGRAYVSPQYWALWLYSNFAGDTPVATETRVREYDVHGGVRRVPEIANVPELDVLATTDSGRHDVTLFVVNRDWQAAVPATIRLRGFAAQPLASVQTLNADSMLAQNDDEHPNAVHPVESSLPVGGDAIRETFAAHSLTVIRFSRAGAAP